MTLRTDNRLDGSDNLRRAYMDGRITHQTYNMALAEILGLRALQWAVRGICHAQVNMPASGLPHISNQEIRATTAYGESTGMRLLWLSYREDRHLNNIPLARWDSAAFGVHQLVARANFAYWSMSDTTCVLKAVARSLIEGC